MEDSTDTWDSFANLAQHNRIVPAFFFLTEAERPQLWGLVQVYQEKLLLKAQALREAVERGLREPLEA